MTLQDFIIEGKREVNSYFKSIGVDDIVIKDIEVVKTNDNRMHALVVGKKIDNGGMMGSNIYVDDLFARYESGGEIEYLMDELKVRCKSAARCTAPPVTGYSSFSFDNIRNRLSVRLLDVKCNRSYMTDRPYIDVGNGLVMVVQINAEETIMSDWIITVNNQLMKTIGCSKDELLTAALSNTIRMEPPVLMRLRDFVYEDEQLNLLDRPIPDGPVPAMTYMLTNESRFKGASALFYPGVMEKLADIFKCGYYVLPSSAHELIIIPDSMEMPVDAMAEMLKHGNEAYVNEDEYLSDRIFHYDPLDRKLRIVKNGPDFPEVPGRYPPS